MNVENILVTNYQQGFKNKPIREIFKYHLLQFNENTSELSVNDSLFIHVFKTLPYMRKLKVNELWFNCNLYHIAPK